MTKPSRSEYYKAWYAKNKEKRAASRAAWEAANKEHLLKKRAEYREKQTPEKRRESYLKRDRVRATERQRAYSLRYPEKTADAMRRYREALRQATPKWLTPLHKALIKKIKADAAMQSAISGVRMTTDHIVPLRSPHVCGLHVPWNIEITSLKDNAAKGHRTWPDMWD